MFTAVKRTTEEASFLHLQIRTKELIIWTFSILHNQEKTQNYTFKDLLWNEMNF
jgi:hypothetical protein